MKTEHTTRYFIIVLDSCSVSYITVLTLFLFITSHYGHSI